MGSYRQNEKNSLCLYLGYFNKSILRGQIGQNGKTTLCRRRRHIDKINYGVK